LQDNVILICTILKPFGDLVMFLNQLDDSIWAKRSYK